jgi:hypothetical protein
MTDSTPVEVTDQVEAHAQQNWLFQALDDLFSENPPSTFTLESTGKVVEIRTAKVKTLREITSLIGSYIGNYTPEELLLLIGMTAKAQEELTNEGANPFQQTLDKIKSFVGGAEMVARITTSGLEFGGELVPMFTNLTVDEFDELSVEEGSIVAYSIFGRNYHFFTQRVRPVVAAFIAHRARQAEKTK